MTKSDTTGFKRDEVTKKLCRKGNDKREYCGRIDKSINKERSRRKDTLETDA